MLLFLQKSNRIVLGVSFLIAFLIGIGIYWLSSFNEEIRGFIYIVPFFVVLFLLTLTYTIMSIINRRNILKNPVFMQDMSHLKSELDDKSRLIADELENMDFSLIGLLGNPKQDATRATMWIYADKQGFTQARVTSGEGHMSYFSVFEDGYSQITGLDIAGFSYRLSGELLTQEIANQVRQTYANHQHAVDAIGGSHGELQLLDSIQSCLNWEKEFGVEYTLKELRKTSLGCGGVSLFLASFLLLLASFIAQEFIEIPKFIGQILAVAPVIIGIAIFFLGKQIGFITTTPNNADTELSKRDAQ